MDTTLRTSESAPCLSTGRLPSLVVKPHRVKGVDGQEDEACEMRGSNGFVGLSDFLECTGMRSASRLNLAPGDEEETDYGFGSWPSTSGFNVTDSVDSDVSMQAADLRLICGLSTPTSMENLRGAQTQTALVEAANRSSWRASRNAALADFDGDLDPELFAAASDRAYNSIEQLRNRHNAYQGRFLDRNTTGHHEKKKSILKEGEDDETDRLRDKLKIYKFARRLEPELPPLTLVASEGSLRKIETHMLKRNTSRKKLLSFLPEAHNAALREKAEKTRQYRPLVLERGVKLLNMSTDRFQASIDRKRQQGDAAIEARRAIHAQAMQHSSGAKSADTQHAEKVQSVVESEAKVEEQPEEEVTQATIMEELMDNPMVTERMQTLVVRFHSKLKIRILRTQAKTVFGCMKHWMNTGRFFVSMTMFRKNIVAIQTWWRQCRHRLREIRDTISRTWMTLERQELIREIVAKDRESYMGGKRRSKVDKLISNLSVEERAELQMIDEASRLRFIEHEMRARRFALLPAIAIWEEEVIKWHKSVKDVKLTADAAEMMDLDKKKVVKDDSFNWPPTRPSYVPPANPRREKNGSCGSPESCPGRRGDEEIRAMWRACRKHPEKKGWREIPPMKTMVPSTFNSSAARKTENVRASGQAKSKTTEESGEKRPFGETTDEELLRWGIDPKAMPGCEGPKGIRAGGDGADNDNMLPC